MNTKERIDVVRKMAHELKTVRDDFKETPKEVAGLADEITAALDRFEAKAKPHDTRTDMDKIHEAQRKAQIDAITPKPTPTDVKGWA